MLTPVPCPNCGSDDLSIDCYDTMRYSYTYVQCNSCLRLVKTMDSTEDTIRRWNDLAARYRKQAYRPIATRRRDPWHLKTSSAGSRDGG